jgi:hypothetical protein
MNSLDELFSEVQFSDKAEKPLEDFSNWILGISIGICALLIFNIKNLDLYRYCFSRPLYITVVIISMLNTVLVGINKYKILTRAINMGVHQGELRKLAFFSKTSTPNSAEIENETKLIFNKWSQEYNNIKIIGKIHNVTLFTTVITLILTGLIILITI